MNDISDIKERVQRLFTPGNLVKRSDNEFTFLIIDFSAGNAQYHLDYLQTVWHDESVRIRDSYSYASIQEIIDCYQVIREGPGS